MRGQFVTVWVLADLPTDDFQQLLDQGAVEAVMALKQIVGGQPHDKSRRDIVAAAEKLLVAAKVGGFGKGSGEGGNVTFLLGSEQVSKLFGTMERVVGSMTVEGTAREVADDAPLLPKPKKRRRKPPAKKTAPAAEPAASVDLLSKAGASGLSPGLVAAAAGADNEEGLEAAGQ